MQLKFILVYMQLKKSTFISAPTVSRTPRAPSLCHRGYRLGWWRVRGDLERGRVRSSVGWHEAVDRAFGGIGSE